MECQIKESYLSEEVPFFKHTYVTHIGIINGFFFRVRLMTNAEATREAQSICLYILEKHI